MEKKSNISVIICENLPLDLTILADKNYCCTKPKADCPYNRSNLSPDIQICYKKTLTPDLPLVRGSLA